MKSDGSTEYVSGTHTQPSYQHPAYKGQVVLKGGVLRPHPLELPPTFAWYSKLAFLPQPVTYPEQLAYPGQVGMAGPRELDQSGLTSPPWLGQDI